MGRNRQQSYQAFVQLQMQTILKPFNYRGREVSLGPRRNYFKLTNYINGVHIICIQLYIEATLDISTTMSLPLTLLLEKAYKVHL